MSDKGLQSGSSTQTNVFSVFRGMGDRYSQFEDDNLMSTSPPSHDDFPVPIKFKPRKSKFHTLHQEDYKPISDSSSTAASPDVVIPKLIISKKPSEVIKQQFTAKFDNQSQGLDSSSPHGSIGTEPSSSAVVKLFEKTHQIGIQNTQLGPISKMVRGSSDTNLKAMVVTSKSKGDSSSNTALAVKDAKDTKKKESSFEGGIIKTNVPIDTVDSTQSTWSSLSGWLYGGKKVMNVENRDMNALGPSSF